MTFAFTRRRGTQAPSRRNAAHGQTRQSGLPPSCPTARNRALPPTRVDALAVGNRVDESCAA